MQRLILVVLMFCGCVAPSQYARILVYQNAPEKPYSVIATLGESNEHLDDLLQNLQARAFKLGGQGIVIAYQKYIGDKEMFHVIAQVIRYKRTLSNPRPYVLK